MAVRGNSLMPFSIQAILNKKDESRHLPDLDMCFSKTACWKIFGEMNGVSRRGDDDVSCEQTNPKNYDSDSGLSDDNDTKTPVPCTSEKYGDPASDVPEESLQEETDHESAAAENTKSDSEPSNTTGKNIRCSSRSIKARLRTKFSISVANAQKDKKRIDFVSRVVSPLVATSAFYHIYARMTIITHHGHAVQERHFSDHLRMHLSL